MNIYNDDAILLSEQSTKAFLSSLITRKDSALLRDEFISNIRDSITISDDGESIIVDIPDIELLDREGYTSIDRSKNVMVETNKIRISVNVSKTRYICYSNENMQQYGAETVNSATRYSLHNVYGDNWYTSTEYQVA